MKVTLLNIVTASVDSGATEVVGAGSPTWPAPSSPGKGYEVEAPHHDAPMGKNDNPYSGKPNGTIDFQMEMIPNKKLTYPLRLRGGGDDNTPSSLTQPIIKRKNTERSPESVRLQDHFREIDISISTTRIILEEMVRKEKIKAQQV